MPMLDKLFDFGDQLLQISVNVTVFKNNLLHVCFLKPALSYYSPLKIIAIDQVPHLAWPNLPLTNRHVNVILVTHYTVRTTSGLDSFPEKTWPVNMATGVGIRKG